MKRTFRLVASAIAFGSLLTACSSKDAATEQSASNPTSETTAPAASAPTPSSEANQSEAPATTTASSFDINEIPVSTSNLGQFPYFGPLKGYEIRYDSDSVAYEFDRSYLYDGQALASVEGRVLRRKYHPADKQKQASDLMIRRNYENLITGLGGVKVFSGEIPDEAIKKVGSSTAEKGGITGYSGEYDIYVIRQKDKEIWVQVQKPSIDSYYLSVTEKAAMPQQVSVIPATELKKN
ncbi:hypothetical protein DNI29_15660 [Hymenobacter sediminis]|uniref:hypothetical protein n=1 Tax=Hymenobacter sediminis TaxID=2218621 RepID=UPI000DA648DF|nr:hypothetical protein [Hymenobacter sediminis]RPD46430.1 hypothetical protein DNI29_15660 [Hymenobacter sediminis]